MLKRINFKRAISILVLLVIALTSVFVFSKIASSPETYAKTIQKLDEKKVTVMELTAATAGASTALALIPGDATQPIANQIVKLSSYLLIVIGAIFLEKILLTLTGYITFTFLIPIACLMCGIYLFLKKDILRNLAIKLGVFGIVICIVIPVSVQVSDLIDDTYPSSIDQTIEDAKSTEIATEEVPIENADETGWWNGVVSKAKEGLAGIGDSVSSWIEKGEKMLSNFIDAIAVLLITSCVIPIAVLFLFLWLIKIILGIHIPTSNIKKMNLNHHLKKQQPDSTMQTFVPEQEKETAISK